MFNLWHKIISYISGLSAGLFIALCFSLMICVILFCTLKLRKLSVTASIVASSILCSFLTVPLITSINAFVASRIEANARISTSSLAAEQKKKDAEIKALREEIELLKSAELSMQSMSRICEMALLETSLKQIDVQKEPLTTKKGAGILADTIVEESLVIQAHDINAKFGVDLRQVKVIEEENTLYISGIKAKYIGSDKNITNHILSEIRKVELKGSSSTTTIFNSSADKELARQKEIDAENNFQKRLAKGLELKFMDDAVVKLAENFITAILSPLKKSIVFTSNDTGKPILEFLSNEINEKNIMLEALD